MQRVIYYLLEDIHNAREMRLIADLSVAGRVVVLSHIRPPSLPLEARWRPLPPATTAMVRLLNLWMKLAFLLGRAAPAATNIEFPQRNLYQGPLATAVINTLWRLKITTGLNRLLPWFDQLFLAPIRLGLWIKGKKVRRRAGRRAVLLFDGLMVRSLPMWMSVLKFRERGAVLLSDVKSWDNPFYSQLFAPADGFTVWGEESAKDMRTTHPRARAPAFAWSARSMLPFIEYVSASADRAPPDHEALIIGYAAGYCEHVLQVDELEVVLQIAAALERHDPTARILFRPYPTQPKEAYARLTDQPNIVVDWIAGEATDRFGDGRETIVFGSPREKLIYLDRCHVFLSLVTSFTIEAAIADRAIVHFWLSPDQRRTSAERRLFDSVDISDHITKYFRGLLPVQTTYAGLAMGLLAAGRGGVGNGAALVDALGANGENCRLGARFEDFLSGLGA